MTARRKFSSDFKARVDNEDEVHDLHAKIGQLTVERELARTYASPQG